MGWFLLAQLVSTLISMLRLGRLSDSEKDLEILILRHQLDILERKQKRAIKPNRAEKLFLAILTARLKQVTNRPARHSMLPAPVRHGSVGWRHLMCHYRQQLLACDFFTVETLWL